MGAIMSLFANLWKARFKSGKLNSDPLQREYADLLINAAEGGIFPEYALKAFVDTYDWKRDDKELRLAHALKMVKARRPDLHKEAVNIAIRFSLDRD
jgi:hypothetical protein